MRSILRVFVILVILIVGGLTLLRWATPSLEWRQMFAGEGCCVNIAHASGLLNGDACAAFPEPYYQKYEAGREISEIDGALTADDHIVLAHDWDAYGGNAQHSLLTVS